MPDISKETQMPQCVQTSVMRSLFLSNKNIVMYVICVIGLVYVNLGLPFRVKRIDYGQTFCELMY